MATMRVHLTFPAELVTEPIIYKLGHDFPVVTNIRRANVTADSGWVDLQLDGKSADIEAAIASLREQGVRVDPIGGDVIQ